MVLNGRHVALLLAGAMAIGAFVHGGVAAPASGGSPLLWSVGSQDGKTSYLFGTIHLPDPRVTALGPEVETAFQKSDAVFVEIPLDPETQVGAAAKMVLSGGKTLKDCLPPKLYKQVAGMFEKHGLPFAPFDRMKVWVIATQIALLDRILEFAVRPALDMVLYNRAGEAKKARGGVETVDEQISIFDSLTLEEQVSMLKGVVQTIEKYEKKGQNSVDALLDAYLSGDEARLDAALSESFDTRDPLNRKLRRMLVDERNVRMAHRIAKKMDERPDQSFFFAVGAAHMLGETGIVELLRAKGFQVKRAR